MRSSNMQISTSGRPFQFGNIRYSQSALGGPLSSMQRGSASSTSFSSKQYEVGGARELLRAADASRQFIKAVGKNPVLTRPASHVRGGAGLASRANHAGASRKLLSSKRLSTNTQLRQSSSEMGGYDGHNALRQFALDQLSILSSKQQEYDKTRTGAVQTVKHSLADPASLITPLTQKRRSVVSKNKATGWHQLEPSSSRYYKSSMQNEPAVQSKTVHANAQGPIASIMETSNDDAATLHDYLNNLELQKTVADAASSQAGSKVGGARRLVDRKRSAMVPNGRKTERMQKKEHSGGDASVRSDADGVEPRGGTIEELVENYGENPYLAAKAPSQVKHSHNHEKQKKDDQGHCSHELQRPYKKNMEKQNLCRRIRDRLRFEFGQMYRAAENAYPALDFTGIGYITEEAFLNSVIVRQRIPFTTEQLRLYFADNNLFSKTQKGMDLDAFKKAFFPQHYPVQDPEDDFEDKVAQANRHSAQHLDAAGQKSVIEKRCKALEQKLKEKFSNCHDSVRKAFLALDADYDGYVTPEDILKYFGNDEGLNYIELKKLLMDHDSKKEGKLNYTDFSKWLGSAIHLQQGFYFRHDTSRNPTYWLNLEKDQKNKGKDKEEAAKALCEGQIDELSQRIVHKFMVQWKTLRSAFMAINRGKSGKITKQELMYYLDFWRIILTEEQFEQIFDRFDVDKDGVIDYKDFVQSIGSDMFPKADLYFRQAVSKQQSRLKVCKQDRCFMPTKNKQNYCDVHQKMHCDESVLLFSKLYKQIGLKQWPKFIEGVKKVADQEDQSQVFLKDFKKLVRSFGGQLNDQQFEAIRLAFPGKDAPDPDDEDDDNDDSNNTVNVVRLYDQKYAQIMQEVFKKVDVANLEDPEEAVDQLGYLGTSKHYREKRVLAPITLEEMLQIMYESGDHEKKLKEIMFTIGKIDTNPTGFVTKTELDDIIKITYPELLDRDIAPVISKFSALQNKICIDYRRFRDRIVRGLADIAAGQATQTTSFLDEVKDAQEKRIQELEKQVQMHKKNEQALKEKIRMTNKARREKLSRLSQHQDSQVPDDHADLPSQYAYTKHSQNKLTQPREDVLHTSEPYGNSSIASSHRVRPRTSLSGRRDATTASYANTKLLADLNEIKSNERVLNSNQSSAIKNQQKVLRPKSSLSRLSDQLNQRRSSERQTGNNNDYENNTRGRTHGLKRAFRSTDRQFNAHGDYQPNSSMKEQQMAESVGSSERKNAINVLRRDDSAGRHGSSYSRLKMFEDLEQLANEEDYGPSHLNLGSASYKRIRDYAENAREAKQVMQQALESEHHYSKSRLVPTDAATMRKLFEYGADPATNHSRSPINRQALDREHDVTRSRSRGPSTDQVSSRKQLYRTVNDFRGRSARRPEQQENVTEHTLLQESLLDPSTEMLLENSIGKQGQLAKDLATPSAANRQRLLIQRSSLMTPNMARTPTNASGRSALGSTSTRFSQFACKSLTNKLAYEWKHIYRALAKLCSVRDDSQNLVSLRQFDAICKKFNVSMHKEDLKQLQKLFSAGDDTLIDFEKISRHLGLHRASYDHLSRSFAQNRSKSAYRLRQFCGSIDPVEEEQDGDQCDSATRRGVLSTDKRPTSRVTENRVRDYSGNGPNQTGRRIKKQIDTMRSANSNEEEVASILRQRIDKFERNIQQQLKRKQLNLQVVRSQTGQKELVLPEPALRQVLSQLGLRVADSSCRAAIPSTE